MENSPNKLKCYVLLISERYPKNHKKAGRPTNFPEKINARYKKHTIRSNYELWKYRIDEINKGNAYLSVRVWNGKPYRSKQKEITRYNKGEIGIEKIKFIHFDGLIEDKTHVCYAILAMNDGLKQEDFIDWFKGTHNKEMAIIHLTSLRYEKRSLKSN